MATMQGRLLAMLIIAISITFSGCSTVTISKEGTEKLTSEPNYQDRKTYYLFGLIGEHTVDVKQTCNGSEARQMQSQIRFTDGLLTIITLGIYAPRTAKVWCEQGETA